MRRAAAARPLSETWIMSMAIISSAFAAEGEQTTHEAVGAGEAHHEGVFPPFQTENFAPQIFWLVVIFGLLYVLMSRIALPRVGGIIENRGAKIASDLGAAREMQSKAQAAAAANDENLRHRRDEAQAIGREAQHKIAAETAKQRTLAESAAAEKIRAADERIASAKTHGAGQCRADRRRRRRRHRREAHRRQNRPSRARQASRGVVELRRGSMHFDAEFYVAVGFSIFVLVMIWVGAHSKFTAFIDARINRIKGELAEAERLRNEAEALLASFEQKRAEAEAEAKAIVAQAKEEAELIAAEGRRRLGEFMDRSVKQVEQKIAQAEAQASAEVRAAAADAAVKIAERALAAGAGAGKDFVGDGIKELKSLAH